MPKSSASSSHLSDVALIQFADGEMTVWAVTATETHLRTCHKCRTRLDELKSSANAYDQYHNHVLKPALELPQGWSDLQARLEALEKPRNWFFPPATMWWVAAALACCVMAAGWLLYREAPTRLMQHVLTQAVSVPMPPHRRLQVTSNGHSWYRAAKFPGATGSRAVAEQQGLQETRALFVKANYSWDDPLSARSFAAWRRQLTSKRDQVISIEDGNQHFYRLQTETANGVLRTAALTLRADTLNPVKGAFHFEHRNDITIDDAGEMPQLPGSRAPTKTHAVQPAPIVRAVGPEDELRVFAALNAIGADAGEPVTVDIDPSRQQITVAAFGLSAVRERQIRRALAPIPNTATRFTSGQPSDLRNQPASPGNYTSQSAAPLRHKLEEQAGGAEQFQLITDKALDASSTILAQANALSVLAQKFPSFVASAFTPQDREVLQSLRHRHAIAIEQAVLELKETLRPLFPSMSTGTNEIQSPAATSWEVGAAQLYEEARLLDASLGRILAGSYSQEAGQSTLNRLPGDIRRMEALVRSQENIR